MSRPTRLVQNTFTTNLPLPPGSRPPTQAEKDIEVARRRTRALYHAPPPGPHPELESWYLDYVTDPIIGPRVKDLYRDREQTNRQQALFLEKKWQNMQPFVYDDNVMWTDREPTAKEYLYDRVLSLYDARQTLMQREAVKRLSMWTLWYAEKIKAEPARNEAFVRACESTLAFLEDDYLKRKVDFVTEIYALLDQAGDKQRAMMVVDDLAALFPWLKQDFCARLVRCVVAYDGLKKVSDCEDVDDERSVLLTYG